MRCSRETGKEKSKVCGDSWRCLPFVLTSLLGAPGVGYTQQRLFEVSWLQRLVTSCDEFASSYSETNHILHSSWETCSFCAFLR